MSAQLVPLTAGPQSPIALARPLMLIGRHPDCDIRLDVPQISRRHCCIANVNEQLVIRDLNSRNGVRVNGRLIDEAPLKPGDEIAIAQWIFRFDAPPAPPRAPRSPLPRPEPKPEPVPNLKPMPAESPSESDLDDVPYFEVLDDLPPDADLSDEF